MTPGYRALFVVPGQRQATSNTPYTADNLIDWPLRPFTAYTRADRTLLWMTDDTPLLGVRDGQPVPLLAVISPACGGPIPCSYPVITGLNANWTNATADTCNGWSTNSDAFEMARGSGQSTTGYLDAGTEISCATSTGKFIIVGASPTFYCIEQ